jgi:hypothetical protein
MGYNSTRVDVVGVAAPGRDVRSPNCPTCCPRVVAVCACVLTLLASVPAYAQPAPRNAPPATALNDALREENAEAIRAAVTAWNRQLGEKAGVPEVADRHVPIPQSGTWLTREESEAAGTPWLKAIESARWWKIGINPQKMDRALREPAAIVAGSLALYRAKLQDSDRALAIAKDAADFLLWAQARAETGVFPFPAARGGARDNAFVSAERFLRRAEKQGRLHEVIRNGWAVNDDGNGGLQFDNGECGVAVLALYEATKEKKYLDAGRKAADWALARPLVSNWNYNSFSVYLLARAYRATGEKKYLEGATKKAMLGVVPGQLRDGLNAGRWNDAHNARPSYHYIMLRGLAELAAVMPKDHAARPELIVSLSLGLKNRNNDVLKRGAAGPGCLGQTHLGAISARPCSRWSKGVGAVSGACCVAGGSARNKQTEYTCLASVQRQVSNGPIAARLATS